MKHLKGYIAISLAALMWGVAASVAKSFFTRAYEPLILVQMRVTLSFAVMFLLQRIQAHRPSRESVPSAGEPVLRTTSRPQSTCQCTWYDN